MDEIDTVLERIDLGAEEPPGRPESAEPEGCGRSFP
jgi:hypothetical protein